MTALLDPLLQQGDGEDFEGEVTKIDGTVHNFEFLERIFFKVAEPGLFDRQGGIESCVSSGVMAFVEADDAMVTGFGFFDGLDNDVAGADLDEGG